MRKPCTVDECEKPHKSHGYCSKHLVRWQKYGDVNFSQRIIGDRDAAFWAKVEKTDGCWNWTAALHEYGYGIFALDQGDGKWRTLRAHRLAWEKLVGPIAPGMFLDHTCHNRKCVNPEHLREVTNKQNIENHSGPTSRNKTGFRGVYWNSEMKCFTFQVRHNEKRHCGGSYATAEAAHEAATALRNTLHTHNDLDRIHQQERAS